MNHQTAVTLDIITKEKSGHKAIYIDIICSKYDGNFSK